MNLPSADFVKDIIMISLVLIGSVAFVGSVKWIDENI